MADQARPPARRDVRARSGLLRRLPRAGRRRPPARDPPAGRRLHHRDLPVAHEPSRARARLEHGRRHRRRVPGAGRRGRPRLPGRGQRGERRDRRRRRWPLRRTGCFLAGLALLVVDLYSGIGSEADVRLSAHMVEHMVMWVLVAPLLAAGAPVRLAFFALGRTGRRRLARGLHSRGGGDADAAGGVGDRVLRGPASSPTSRPSTGWPRVTTTSTRSSTPCTSRPRCSSGSRCSASIRCLTARPARPARVHAYVHGADAGGRGVAGDGGQRRLRPLPGLARARLARCMTSAWRRRSCGPAGCRRSSCRR